IKDLVVFRQTHSTTVVTLTERPDRTVAIEADAMVTNRPDLLLGILTADCAPVLLADPAAGIIGAAHAGWKGAAGGILHGTVKATAAPGPAPSNTRPALGPPRPPPNYEIGPDTARDIAALDAAAAAHVTLPPGKTREHFASPGLLSEQRFGAGVGTVG